MKLNDEKALQDVSLLLSVPREWLYNLIRFESHLDPLARNKISGARGLIQFLHSTAKGMGFKDADDLVSKYPDFASQIRGPVYTYLKKYLPFPTEQSLYMAVFYPVARTWPIDKAFPPNVQKVNPGIVTVHDYVKKVNKNFSVLPLFAIVAIVGISYYILQGESAIWHSHNRTTQILT